ncbi:MAG: tRNA epoxyqueuosine(34) reductase QueG [Candidatus Omnitrophica bacterium]|nr:tRNA epoxyqueuosine(34) reductase QueG [Candidatus Omnitrophota bacterium]
MPLWPNTWTPGSVEDRVHRFAVEAGFDAVGFAEAGPVDPETSENYRVWLDQGYQAGMDYMERRVEERLDPRNILPSARSIIVVLSNYYRDNPSQELNRGKVARYAGGRDYHRVVGNQLRSLKRRIEEQFPNSENWYSVDAGPILERYWAQKSGVGFNGKNTLLINTRMGSWVFIGVMLTSLELKASGAHTDHCGTCTRCLDACPTDAFPQPGVLDSNKCISYWTIEHRGDFKEDIGRNLNGWLFGCDDCQTVCPWNRHAKQTTHADYEARPPFRSPDIKAISRMTREEWDEATRGTAIRRATYEGLIRNAEALRET